MKKEFYTKAQVDAYLNEHIIRGDKGDGVPNILSNDDVFVTGGRQSPIYETKISVWMKQEPEEYCDDKMLANYYRNKSLVDLTQIPIEIEAAILESWQKPIKGARNKIYGYLIKKKMKHLLDCIHEF